MFQVRTLVSSHTSHVPQCTYRTDPAHDRNAPKGTPWGLKESWRKVTLLDCASSTLPLHAGNNVYAVHAKTRLLRNRVGAVARGLQLPTNVEISPHGYSFHDAPMLTDLRRPETATSESPTAVPPTKAMRTEASFLEDKPCVLLQAFVVGFHVRKDYTSKQQFHREKNLSCPEAW